MTNVCKKLSCRNFPRKAPRERDANKRRFSLIKTNFHINSPVDYQYQYSTYDINFNPSRSVVERENVLHFAADHVKWRHARHRLDYSLCLATTVWASDGRLKAKNGYYVSRLIVWYRIEDWRMPFSQNISEAELAVILFRVKAISAHLSFPWPPRSARFFSDSRSPLRSSHFSS